MRPPTLLSCCFILFTLCQLILSFSSVVNGDATSTALSSCNASSFTRCANLRNNPYPLWTSAACAASPSYVLSNCTPSSTLAHWDLFSDAALGVLGSPAVTSVTDSTTASAPLITTVSATRKFDSVTRKTTVFVTDESASANFMRAIQLCWNTSLGDLGPCPPLFSAASLSLYNIPSSINLTRFPDSSDLRFSPNNTILLFNCAHNPSTAQSGLRTETFVKESPSGCTPYKKLCESLADTSCIEWSVGLLLKELSLQQVLDTLACSHFMFGTFTSLNFTMFTPSVFELLWEDIQCRKCLQARGKCAYVEAGLKKFSHCECHGRSIYFNTQACAYPIWPSACFVGPLRCSIAVQLGIIGVVAMVAGLGLCVLIRVGFPARFSKFSVPIVVRILKKIVRKLQSINLKHTHLLDLLDLDGLTERPTEYTYSSIASATKSFSSRVGEGGFGTVYKGTLTQPSSSHGGSIEQQIAVKVLDAKSKHNKKQFLNEVVTIGRIHHVNVVRLLGFCMQLEDPDMLVYEFVVNGSLDRWLFEKKDKPQAASHVLDWGQRYVVALGVARGLSYLHEECRHRTVHCDIKPQNILLDADMHPKIADFGLARLMNRDESKVLTFAKGTPGYMAPEFWMGGESHLSTKFDVYSYGMVLLELISGQRNFGGVAVGSNGSSSFPAKAFRAATIGDLESVIDARLDIKSDADDAQKQVQWQQVKTAAFVALWCIQDNPAMRPPMSEVVKYLEGGATISECPPQPAISNISWASCPQQDQLFHTNWQHDNECTPLTVGR